MTKKVNLFTSKGHEWAAKIVLGQDSSYFWRTILLVFEEKCFGVMDPLLLKRQW
jgi:hypothetical protein